MMLFRTYRWKICHLEELVPAEWVLIMGTMVSKEFSHAKAVYKQSKLNLMKLAGLVPPYKKKEDKASA